MTALATHLPSLSAPPAENAVAHFAGPAALTLESGQTLSELNIAYTTHGVLNGAKSNAIFICHALTGDQYAGMMNPLTGRPGWWDLMVGPGKPFDTNRFFIISSNVVGGCMGTTGPKDTDPATRKPYGLTFPVITIRDMVRAQSMLVDRLGVSELLCVAGGSMGGMQVLEWMASYPERLVSAMPIATAAKHSAQNIAFHEVGRQAIMADPDWRAGAYLAEGTFPSKGLAVARMAAHITYLSEAALQRKFGRELQDRASVSYAFDADFQVESYLRHQGRSFVERFDANSYLYITRAMDYFDLAADHGGMLSAAFQRLKARVCVASFTSDWLFPTRESKRVVHALNAVAANVSFVEFDTDKGHDAFLLDMPEMVSTFGSFVDSAASHRGLKKAG
jgi:homoserine O-acetyltransferase